MSSATLLPNAEQQFCDANGAPYAGGFVYNYVPGTTTFKATYQDEDATTLNSNPVILDSAGRARILGIGDYRQVLTDSLGNQIWDQTTTSALPTDAISAAMAPVVAASTSAQARDLLGVTGAIQTAVTNISLQAGPTGPAGATGAAGAVGPTGPQGVAGPTGPGPAPSNSTAIVYTGFANADENGYVNISFPASFPTQVTDAEIHAPGGGGVVADASWLVLGYALTVLTQSGMQWYVTQPRLQVAWVAIGT